MVNLWFVLLAPEKILDLHFVHYSLARRSPLPKTGQLSVNSALQCKGTESSRSASCILVCLTTLPASPSKALSERAPARTPNREVEHGIALTLLPASWLMPVAQPHTPHHRFCFPRTTPGRKPRSHLQTHPSSLFLLPTISWDQKRQFSPTFFSSLHLIYMKL